MTDRELAAQAETSLRRTTVSYPEWVRRRAAGRYANDGAGTEWGKAFAALQKIGATAPPPPSGDLLFDGMPNGQLSPTWNHDFSQGCTVVDSPAGRIMRARTTGSVSMLNVGQSFEAYQLPWEVIPADVWHGFTAVIPDGQDAAWPGAFVASTPGSGWDMLWELHNRTDSASGYVQGQTPGSYVSTMLLVKNQGDGTLRWVFQPAGGTLPQPASRRFELGVPIVRNRPYRHAIRLKHGHTFESGYFEWWVDGTKVFEGAHPTAYVCADGKSGERLQTGIYRGGFSGETTVYVSPTRVGTTRAIVGAQVVATSTFSVAADADDGSGWKEHTVWASIASGTFTDGSVAFDDTILGLQKQLVGGTYRVNLAFLRFDTSSLPDNATITAANLLLYCTEKLENESTAFAADYYDFGGEPPVDADWELTSSGDCITSFTLGSLTGAAVNTIAFTGLTGISKTGITGIRVAPANTTAPTVQNYALLASREHLTGQEPRLEVTTLDVIPVRSQHLDFDYSR